MKVSFTTAGVLRWIKRGIDTIGVFFLVLSGLLLVGCWSDNRIIEDDPVTTRAEVVSARSNVVVVRYVTATSPSLRVNSLVSPGGIYGLYTKDVPRSGEGVMVEYARSNPDLVRVAGRGLGWAASRVVAFIAVVALGMCLARWALLKVMKRVHDRP